MKKGDEIKDSKNEHYIIVASLGRGGQAKVWKVRKKNSNAEFAFKFYKNVKRNIRKNIEDLIKLGTLKNSKGDAINSVVLPISIVNGEGGSFGYIMDLVCLDNYTTLKKAWSKGPYPSANIICRIIQNLASFFKALHATYGMCYKDLNEGNVFINPTTGDVKIIDNDNIGYANNFTIKGTTGYMAPEVVLGAKPDERSDNFSFAVYVFRLLTGGYPFEGKYTKKYCENHDLCEADARKVIFGEDPVFVWHPSDRRNSIEDSKDPQLKYQVLYWKNLPKSIKDLFLNTFATNLKEDRKAMRASAEMWHEVFSKLENKVVQCKKCGYKTFAESKYCNTCFAPLQSSKKEPSVTLKLLSEGQEKREIKLHVSDILNGQDISKHLSSGAFLKIRYNRKIHKLGIENLSAITWKIKKNDGKITECKPGSIMVLENDMMIRFIPKKAQINVISIQ